MKVDSGAAWRLIEGWEIAMGPWCTQMSAGGWVAMTIFWVVVVGLLLWAVGRLFPAQGSSDPRVLLDSRLAAGEITPEAYRSIRDELDGHASAGAKDAARADQGAGVPSAPEGRSAR